MKSFFTAQVGSVLSVLLALSHAAVVKHDFNVSWVTANPDGAFDRPVIGINGKWPIPRIDANIGDNIIINVHNHLGNQSTSLHFHGLFMNGTTQMDGPSQVSQCPIQPGESMTYNFTIQQPGTYWYHSHTISQYPDGLRGPLIIHDPDFPFQDDYDEEIVLTLSDWYHEQMQVLIPPFMSKGNPTGAEPVPKAALMNDTQNLTISVEPEKTYLFRVVNMGAFAGQYLWIEGHNMTIVEVDGVYTKPAVADMIYVSVAQRCSFMVTTKKGDTANFPIIGSMDTTLFDVLPPELNYNVTGWLVYDDKKTLPEPQTVDSLDDVVFDDMKLVPYDEMGRLPEPDRTVTLDVMMDNLGDGANYAFFNNITYKSPKVPSLYTALSAGKLATDPTVYGEYTHPFVLDKGEVVQIVLNNLDSGRHPFHLHGHHFQALHRAPEEGGVFSTSVTKEDDLPKVPMRRDTMVVWPNGNIVLRFRADNPGVWLFHCHIEWHVTSGLIATFIEAPLELQKNLTIPQDHLDVCKKGGIATTGNAAANTEDYLDLSGQNKPPAPLPAGFTDRGIVAIVFSGVAGVLGIIVVAWYGMSGTSDDTEKSSEVGVVSQREPESSGEAASHQSNGSETAAVPKAGDGPRVTVQ